MPDIPSIDDLHIVGLDIPHTLAVVDAALSSDLIELVAAQIVQRVRELAADPANHTETAGCIPLRLVRDTYGARREYFDAAIRRMDAMDGPPIEITYMDNPTPADIAAAVLTPGPTPGEMFLSNQLAPITG